MKSEKHYILPKKQLFMEPLTQNTRALDTFKLYKTQLAMMYVPGIAVWQAIWV